MVCYLTIYLLLLGPTVDKIVKASREILSYNQNAEHCVKVSMSQRLNVVIVRSDCLQNINNWHNPTLHLINL